MDDRLDLAVKNYYEEQSLSEESLKQIRGRIEKRGEPKAPAKVDSVSLMTGVAAVIATIAVATAAWLNVVNVADQEALQQRVIEQAAMLHHQQLDVEVEATDYREVRARLDRLGFSPAEPARLLGAETRLIGARYATIDGVPAVQIKFFDPAGNVCSLYEAPASGRLADLAPVSREVDGVGVDVWQEKGLVMVLTRPLT